MKGPWLQNVSEQEACRRPGSPNTVVISITEPDRWAPLRMGWLAVMRLQFQDYSTEWADGTPRKYPKAAKLFTEGHARAVVEFVTTHRGKNILVHCAGGVSRSGAIVDVLLQAFPEYEGPRLAATSESNRDTPSPARIRTRSGGRGDTRRCVGAAAVGLPPGGETWQRSPICSRC